MFSVRIAKKFVYPGEKFCDQILMVCVSAANIWFSGIPVQKIMSYNKVTCGHITKINTYSRLFLLRHGINQCCKSRINNNIYKYPVYVKFFENKLHLL